MERGNCTYCGDTGRRPVNEHTPVDMAAHSREIILMPHQLTQVHTCLRGRDGRDTIPELGHFYEESLPGNP